MDYPFKYPEVYAELARQAKDKTCLAKHLGITLAGLRYKQTVGDFTGSEMALTAEYLNKSTAELFCLDKNST